MTWVGETWLAMVIRSSKHRTWTSLLSREWSTSNVTQRVEFAPLPALRFWQAEHLIGMVSGDGYPVGIILIWENRRSRLRSCWRRRGIIPAMLGNGIWMESSTAMNNLNPMIMVTTIGWLPRTMLRPIIRTQPILWEMANRLVKWMGIPLLS